MYCFLHSCFPLITDGDEKSFLTLCLLSALIDPLSSKKKHKFSRKEILDDFFLFIPSSGEKSIELQRRQDRLKSVGAKPQPVPVAVGTENPQYSVELNEYIYDVESPIEAIDTCFKLIMVLNAQYSPFSHYVWLFIQQHFFKIATKFDSPVPSLEALAASLGLI